MFYKHKYLSIFGLAIIKIDSFSILIATEKTISDTKCLQINRFVNTYY